MTGVFESIFYGLCQGFGGMLGGYFATKYALQHIDKGAEKAKTLYERIKNAWKELIGE